VVRFWHMWAYQALADPVDEDHAAIARLRQEVMRPLLLDGKEERVRTLQQLLHSPR
jgi:putative ubiquitin-RnfH superfamily antitoxin RatB of RatAB toxin-antitoxin module